MESIDAKNQNYLWSNDRLHKKNIIKKLRRIKKKLHKFDSHKFSLKYINLLLKLIRVQFFRVLLSWKYKRTKFSHYSWPIGNKPFMSGDNFLVISFILFLPVYILYLQFSGNTSDSGKGAFMTLLWTILMVSVSANFLKWYFSLSKTYQIILFGSFVAWQLFIFVPMEHFTTGSLSKLISSDYVPSKQLIISLSILKFISYSFIVFGGWVFFSAFQSICIIIRSVIDNNDWYEIFLVSLPTYIIVAISLVYYMDILKNPQNPLLFDQNKVIVNFDFNEKLTCGKIHNLEVSNKLLTDNNFVIYSPKKLLSKHFHQISCEQVEKVEGYLSSLKFKQSH